MLAAGASSRLGEPKALAEIGGRIVVDRLLEASSEVGAGRAIVVTGAHHEEILAHVEDRAVVVRCERWAQGRLASFCAGVTATEGADILLAPVDVPMVRAETFALLEGAWRSESSPPRGWLAPWWRADRRRFGHPIVIGRDLARAAQALGPGEPLKTLRARAEPLLEIETSDATILDDLDTPSDLARLRGRSH